MKTNIKDKFGKDISVGNHVIFIWGWSNFGGKVFERRSLHKIEMRQDRNVIRFMLSGCANHWDGSEVELVKDCDVERVREEIKEELLYEIRANRKWIEGIE